MPRPPCYFHARGECARGARCAFSHETADAQALALPCKYFVSEGHCRYGDRCRFDHPSGANRSGSSRGTDASSGAAAEPALTSAAEAFGAGAGDEGSSPRVAPAPSSWAGIFAPPPSEEALAAWLRAEEEEEAAAEAAAAVARGLGGLRIVDDDEDRFGGPLSFPAPPADDAPGALAADGDAPTSDGGLCGEFAATGACSRGERCPLPHGDLCETCGRRALHPTDEALRVGHAAECSARAARVAELTFSKTVECGICLERVLLKEGCPPSDRRFGLLACEHAFCLPCVRRWRKGQSGIDVATSLRTCPLCRTPAWFVTPSSTWPASTEARLEVIDAYKRSLSGIECRWWNRGRGSCPFGTSCFYSHVDADGREVARGEGLRFVGDAEGVVKPISQGNRLGDFLEFARVERTGGGGGRRRR